jgi:hypothetical protein
MRTAMSNCSNGEVHLAQEIYPSVTQPCLAWLLRCVTKTGVNAPAW